MNNKKDEMIDTKNADENVNQFPNLPSDVESQNFNTTSSFTNNNSELRIERYEFVASSWSKFKEHFIYQITIEFNLLKDWRNWFYIVLGLGIVYLHVVAHNLAYYLSDPRPALNDLFYDIIPALDVDSVLFQMNTLLLFLMFY